MRLRRRASGIDLNPEEFIAIGQEFKSEVKKNNISRAIEVLGKYNQKTLLKIFEFNNPLISLNQSLNSQLSSAVQRLKINEPANEANKENKENKDINQQDYKNINSEIFPHRKSYSSIFTPKEINLIKEMSLEKDKVLNYLQTNSLTLDSAILRNSFAFSINLKGIKKKTN